MNLPSIDYALALARANYEAYIALSAPELQLTDLHRRLARLLDGVVRFKDAHKFAADGTVERTYPGGARRVIISFFPRGGKSTFAAKELVSYAHGVAATTQQPLNVMLTAHTADLVEEFSEHAQRRMKDGVFKAIFPECEIDPSKSSIARWRTKVRGNGGGGQTMAFGILAGSLGRGANLLIVDDPHANLDAADSRAKSEKVYTTFKSDLLGRLDPIRGNVIIIMSRQNPMDLVGRVMADETRDDWEFYSFPICDENGQSCWPEMFSNEWVAKKRIEVTERPWQAQYLGRPYIKTDNSIDRDSWRWIEPDALPLDVAWCYGIDPAATTRTRSDYTATARMGRSRQGGEYYIDGGIFGRWDWPRAKAMISEMVKRAPAPVGMEAVSGFKTAHAELRDALAGVATVQQVPYASDKMARAWGWLSLHATGKLKLVRRPETARWFGEFLFECESFGSRNVHDDLIDGVGVAYEIAKRAGSRVVSGFF